MLICYKQTEEKEDTEKERGDTMAENTTKELDFDRKHEEDLQRLRGLRLLDDDFMQKVFEDKACTEFLLQIILNRTDLKVLRVNGQQDIKNLQGRSVRLDILAVDANNRVYNIEIQRSDKGAGVKRARYNSSLIDANVTEPGEKYENLCESYVIFITENDIMKAGLPIYHVDRMVKETGELFGDESHIIYVNSQIKDESALGKLMHDFSCTDAKDMNIYDDCLKQSILKSRNILANWFWRGEQNQLVKILDNVSLALIKNSILNDETFDAQRKFNLRWSLLEYLDDQEVGVHMSEIRNQLREHINVAKDVDWDFISDEEYSYAVGQAVSYLLHLSKANNKTESYVNPFFNAKNSKVIKQRLLRMYKKYNYQIIHINGGRNAQLLSHVMEYEPKEIKHELIMAGFTAPSLMYEKKTDDEDNE